MRKRRRQENEFLTRFCCFLLSVSESRFKCGCSDCVFVKGNVTHQSPFLFSALSTMSFLWHPRRPPQGSAGGSLFTLGRATTSGQSMMSSFCRRGRNTSSPWPIQPCHRSGIGFSILCAVHSGCCLSYIMRFSCFVERLRRKKHISSFMFQPQVLNAR